ncbi:hydroxymethylpyrimidine/phosphomethylpyrimidine kinase [Jeongeupia sp. HS-3]|nr:hydroxymethylpyrimidine/phosphomethylpyrimidine kinase [Jeongeupia sp. HS-3]BCL76812.1 hydroxymethylpyrimidine/phosphomethylpyrimidine kinase [Jeongeupia sp. HS-3]
MSADILTLAALGCHALPVISALTVHDSAGLQEFQPVDPEWLHDQARYVLEDAEVNAIKVGMVGSVENLTVLAEIAADYPEIPLILDPVLPGVHSDEMAADEYLAALRDLLVPHSLIVTPNQHEARLLASDDVDEQEDLPLDAAANRIIQLGCEYVLITGSQAQTPKVINALFSQNGRVRTDSWDRLPGRFHGAGATLSAAIAGALANDVELVQAVRDAQDFTWQTLKNAFRPGMGQPLPDRMFWARAGAEADETGAAEPEA